MNDYKSNISWEYKNSDFNLPDEENKIKKLILAISLQATVNISAYQLEKMEKRFLDDGIEIFPTHLQKNENCYEEVKILYEEIIKLISTHLNVFLHRILKLEEEIFPIYKKEDKKYENPILEPIQNRIEKIAEIYLKNIEN